jgi:hypothetical protein
MRRSGDLPDLIQDWRNRVRAQRLGVARKLLLPETQGFGIAHAADDSFAEAVVGVEARKIDQGRVLSRNKSRDAVEKEMLKARSPAVGPKVLERCNDAGSGQRPALGRDPGRGIEADRISHPHAVMQELYSVAVASARALNIASASFRANSLKKWTLRPRASDNLFAAWRAICASSRNCPGVTAAFLNAAS